jgi:hypothetical protein
VDFDFAEVKFDAPAAEIEVGEIGKMGSGSIFLHFACFVRQRR